MRDKRVGRLTLSSFRGAHLLPSLTFLLGAPLEEALPA